MRKLYAVEVYDQGWKVKAVSTSQDFARLSFENLVEGRRARINEYTYDTLSFLWTHARDCVTVEKNDEAEPLS